MVRGLWEPLCPRSSARTSFLVFTAAIAAFGFSSVFASAQDSRPIKTAKNDPGAIQRLGDQFGGFDGLFVLLGQLLGSKDMKGYPPQQQGGHEHQAKRQQQPQPQGEITPNLHYSNCHSEFSLLAAARIAYLAREAAG